jgi:anti-sigma regulatory factor (Ser/Thr protein kinase)
MALRATPREVAVDLAPGDLLALVSDGIFEYRNAAGEDFGEQRVIDVIAARHAEPAAALVDAMLAGVRSFAAGATQEDDMTLVVLKRQAMSDRRRFGRTFASIPAIVAHTAEAFARHRLDETLRPTVDLAVEELFTNIVKYSTMSAADVTIELAPVDGGLEVTLVDDDVEPFDVTRSPDVDTGRPIEERTPGGLGLHLVRRLVDSLDYRYDPQRRQSRITFRITAAGRQARAAPQAEG